MEKKFTKGNWTYSPMRGTHGHCFAAQVWDSEGHNLATIETKNGEIEATANAKLIAAAPEMFEALYECIKLLDYLGYRNGNVSQNSKQAIKKATE